MLDSVIQRTAAKLEADGTLSTAAVERVLRALSRNRLRTTIEFRTALADPARAEDAHDEDHVAHDH